MEHAWFFTGRTRVDTVEMRCRDCDEELWLPQEHWDAAIEAQTLNVPEITQAFPDWWLRTGSTEKSNCPNRR